jgi:hypothetical protein
MFAGAPAEKDTDAEAFLVWGHADYFFRKIRAAKERSRKQFPEEG